ncbi:AAA family ATPase [Streptomyces sp. NPDC088739]|uniref:AAA family ATPase n=1 Tax=Streptomyces sp. NPDC088739 TaxID=3365882 RepID=UPI003805DE7F
MSTTLTRDTDVSRAFWAILAANVMVEKTAPHIVTPVPGARAAGTPVPGPGGVPRSEALGSTGYGSRARRVVYAVGGLKGGVGKTTFAMYLALYWAMKLKRVLYIDADPVSSTAFDWYEEARKPREGHPGGTPLPFDLEHVPSDKLDKIINARWLDYDVIVVDCGGESGGIWTSTAKACDHMVVVVGPKKAEVRKVEATFHAAIDAIREVGRLDDVTPHVVFTRVMRQRDQGEDSHNQAMRDKLTASKMPLLNAEVPYLVEYEDAVDTLPARLGHYEQVFDEMHEGEAA